METKQFTLLVTRPCGIESEITFTACEWLYLHQASQSIIGQYGYKIVIELFGRTFVLSVDKAKRLADCDYRSPWVSPVKATSRRCM